MSKLKAFKFAEKYLNVAQMRKRIDSSSIQYVVGEGEYAGY